MRWALKTTTAGAARTGSLLPPRGSPWGPYYFTVEAGAMLPVAGAVTVAVASAELKDTPKLPVLDQVKFSVLVAIILVNPSPAFVKP